MSFLSLLKSLNPFRSQPPKPPAEPPPSAGGGDSDEWLLSGAWLHVASSNVEAIRYLFDAELLEVEFKSKRLSDGSITPSSFYQYYNVPPSVAAGMKNTSSPGRYVWNALRDKFPYVALQGFAAKTSHKPTVIRARNDVPKWLKTQKGLKP